MAIPMPLCVFVHSALRSPRQSSVAKQSQLFRVVGEGIRGAFEARPVHATPPWAVPRSSAWHGVAARVRATSRPMPVQCPSNASRVLPNSLPSSLAFPLHLYFGHA
jgi:hypothetical protein